MSIGATKYAGLRKENEKYPLIPGVPLQNIQQDIIDLDKDGNPKLDDTGYIDPRETWQPNITLKGFTNDLLKTYHLLGGQAFLIDFARKHPKDFIKLMLKVLELNEVVNMGDKVVKNNPSVLVLCDSRKIAGEINIDVRGKNNGNFPEYSNKEDNEH